MERMVGTPNFLLKLTSASNAKPRAGTQKEIQQGNANVGPDVTQAEFWEDGSLPADDDDVLDPCSEGFEKVNSGAQDDGSCCTTLWRLIMPCPVSLEVWIVLLPFMLFHPRHEVSKTGEGLAWR